MAFKYFLYSDEQIKEKNEVMAKAGKYFIPGYVAINGNRVKFTQLSDSPTIPRFVDTKIVAKGELKDFTFTEPSFSIKRGN